MTWINYCIVRIAEYAFSASSKSIRTTKYFQEEALTQKVKVLLYIKSWRESSLSREKKWRNLWRRTSRLLLLDKRLQAN